MTDKSTDKLTASPLQRLAGVGPGLTKKLARIGIHAPRDLLFHLPLRYQDRTRISPIGGLQAGQNALVVGRVDGADVTYGRRRALLVRVSDGSGAMMLRFFHFSAAQQRGFAPQLWVSCYGEVRHGAALPEMVHPEYRLHRERPDDPTEAALTPVYPSTEGVGAAKMRGLVAQVLDEELGAEFGNVRDCLPDEVRRRFGLMALRDALQAVHNPPPDADTAALISGTAPAQQRLAVEELLAHHLALSRLRAKHRKRNAPALSAGESWAKLQANLGFELTGAQVRVVDEILADINTNAPAMRLIQGDVGSGKTVVAAAAALCAVDAGYQAALMAPTELLAEQHRKTFADWFERLGISVEWLTGKLPAAARRDALSRIKSGAAEMVIGTHALFQQRVEFHRLGLMIIDEQHRFGVDQRLALRNKGGDGGHVNDAAVTDDDAAVVTGDAAVVTGDGDGDAVTGDAAVVTGDGDGDAITVPHQIIMSATPIPRSLAMIFYADLDVSNLDELPPGRKPVATVVLPNSRRGEVAERIRGICRDRQQAYWVCPLIEESDKLQAQAATETRDALGELLPEIRIELIHGRMKSADKESIMRRFHGGEIDLLVATTVIEVGVDVPRASLMIIENAERLGLAQLHQLRGRVGRGAAQATCVLMYQPPLGKTARERLGILRETNDGFVIANKDLQQRGPGELLGTKQTGIAQMKIADLVRDRALLPKIEQIGRMVTQKFPGAVDEIVRRWIQEKELYGDV